MLSGCPNACGQHWIADVGFYGNARKIEGRELPYYLMLLGGGYDGAGVRCTLGSPSRPYPHALRPKPSSRVLEHYIAHRNPDESFREYVLRWKVQTFKELTQDLAKPAELYPELYKDMGRRSYHVSKQLGRSECAA